MCLDSDTPKNPRQYTSEISLWRSTHFAYMAFQAAVKASFADRTSTSTVLIVSPTCEALMDERPVNHSGVFGVAKTHNDDRTVYSFVVSCCAAVRADVMRASTIIVSGFIIISESNLEVSLKFIIIARFVIHTFLESSISA